MPRTYEGHGSDRAVLGGLMDWATDDDRLREALRHAQENGLDYRFRAISNASDRHPNTIRIELEGPTRSVVVEGVSRGGGLISIVEIDGFRCNFSGQLPTLIVTALDVEGSVAFISSVISHDECNIATMTVNRTARNDRAKLVMEMDSPLRPLTLDYLRSLKWVQGRNLPGFAGGVAPVPRFRCTFAPGMLKATYRILSIALKAGITLAAIGYVYLRLRGESAAQWQQIAHFAGDQWILLVITGLLVPVNWGLEALKWWWMVRRYYPEEPYSSCFQFRDCRNHHRHFLRPTASENMQDASSTSPPATAPRP